MSEVVEGVGEVELEVVLDGTVLHDPLEGVEVLVVLLLHVEVGDRQVEDVLIEGRREVGVQQIAVVKSLSCDAADESEVLQMLSVDVALRRGVVSVAV